MFVISMCDFEISSDGLAGLADFDGRRNMEITLEHRDNVGVISVVVKTLGELRRRGATDRSRPPGS